MKLTLHFTRIAMLSLGLFFTGIAVKAQATYTYVVEEFNFTNSSTTSESGDVKMQDFGIVGAENAIANEVTTSLKGQLRYEGIDESNEKDVTPISSGKIHVYMTLSSFNLEVIPASNPGALGGAYSDGVERLVAVHLVDNTSGDVDIARLRLRADYRNSDVDEAMRIGGDNNQTASVGGYPFNFQKSDTAVTVGMTVDLDNNTYAYWTNNPNEDDANWFATSSGRTGSLQAAAQGLTFNELEFRIDHISGSFGDVTEPRNADNFIEFDRILVLHETTVAPTTVSLSAATEDNAVVISSNETTTQSVRVQSLTIDAGTTLTVDEGHELTVIDDLIINGTLSVTSSGSLKTYGSVTVGSSGTFEKTRATTFSTSEGQYSAIGSPVVGASTDLLGAFTYSYNESATVANLNDRFIPVTSSETMAAGDAYFSANLGEITFAGIPNTGNIDVSLVYNAGEGADAGWNLVSNPYPSAIELGSFVSRNPDISGPIYIWDDGGSDDVARTNSDYVVVSASGTATAGSGRATSFDGYIRSEQGFFVQATKAGKLHFNETMKAGMIPNTNVGYFRTEKDNTNLLRVFLESDTQVSDMVLEVNNKATSGFDRSYDARRLNAGKEIGIYSFMEMNDENWVIQGLSQDDLSSNIWLGVDISKAGEYNLRFEDGISTELFLYDHLTNEVIDLQEQTSYTFTSEANTIGQKRFSVSSSYNVKAALNIDQSLDEKTFRAYFSTSELVVLSKNGFENASVTAHDLQGKLLYTKDNLNDVSRELRIPMSQGKGIIIVTFFNAGTKESIKLIR